MHINLHNILIISAYKLGRVKISAHIWNFLISGLHKCPSSNSIRNLLENTDFSRLVFDAAWIVRSKRTAIKMLTYFDRTQGP